MKMRARIGRVVAVMVVGAFGGAALAQHHGAGAGGGQGQPAAGEARVGDPYPLETCPISGKTLGEMGDPVVKLYDGREVRYCCDGCPGKFEKKLEANLAKLDEKITKDQAPLYPLKTSLVTGKDLPEKPYRFVYGNRLIVLGAEAEKAEFLNEAKKYMDALDQAVIAAQVKDYPLARCPVSGDELENVRTPQDVVVAGRLIRLCCNDCRKDLEADPSKFIAMVDEARKAAKDHGDAGQPHEPK